MLMLGSWNLIEDLKRSLTARFDMHDLGQASFSLDFQIQFVRDGGLVYLSQHAYVETVLEGFGMGDVRTIGTPMDVKHYKENMVHRSLSGAKPAIRLSTRANWAVSCI
jgi:hypothetical protein